jgi:hypothetical protein
MTGIRSWTAEVKAFGVVVKIEQLLTQSHDTPVVIMHQDAFAADYQEEEYRLIGLAIKFAGICGKEVRVIGTNRQTVDQSTTTY